MRLHRPLCLGVLLALPVIAKPVYKCEEKGRITYTDQPCSADAQAAQLPKLTVTAPPTRSEQAAARAYDERMAREHAERDRGDAEWLRRHHTQRDREARARKAIVKHKVTRDMTADEVK